MTTFEVLLLLATLLCSLTAGFVFAFASVVMPGIRTLDDREFIRAFQVIDGVIQKGQPIFGLVWIGSVAALLASSVLGIWQLDGAERLIIVLAAFAYVLGVQLPTFTINVPLNNRLQTLDVGAMNGAELANARNGFEHRWVLWNSIRTGLATLVSVVLMTLLFRI